MMLYQNFQITKSVYLEDFGVNAMILQHNRSGARICILPDEDVFTFCVTICAPSADDTGIAHVVEHLVCRGTDHSNVCSILDEIKQRVTGVYFNAVTRNDSTTYAISCPLVENYALCASWVVNSIFNPRFINEPSLFLEEGWRQDENNEENIKGVVYNEVSQKERDPIRILRRIAVKSLFPNNIYGVDCGGISEKITTLTNQDCIEFYYQFYNPTNMYFLVAGNINLEPVLKMLDSSLKHCTRTTLAEKITSQRPIAGHEMGMDNFPIKYWFSSYQAVCGTYKDTLNSIMMQVLVQTMEIFVATTTSLCGSAYISCETELFVKQPWYRVSVIGEVDGDYGRILAKIKDKVLCKNNVEEVSKIALEVLDLVYQNYKSPQYKHVPPSVLRWYSILRYWLYSDEDPFCYLKLSGVFAQARDIIQSGDVSIWMNRFLNSRHHSVISNFHSQAGVKREEKFGILTDLKQTKKRTNIEPRDMRKYHRYEEHTKKDGVLLYSFGTEDDRPQADIYYDFSILSKHEMMYLRVLADYLNQFLSNCIDKYCSIVPMVIEHRDNKVLYKLVVNCPLKVINDILVKLSSPDLYSDEVLEDLIKSIQRKIIYSIKKQCRWFAANRSCISFSKQAEFLDLFQGKTQLDFLAQHTELLSKTEFAANLRAVHSQIFRKEHMIISALTQSGQRVETGLEYLVDGKIKKFGFHPPSKPTIYKNEWYVVDKSVNTVAISNRMLLPMQGNRAAAIVVRDMYNLLMSKHLRHKYGNYSCELWVNLENGNLTVSSYYDADINLSIMRIKEMIKFLDSFTVSNINEMIDTARRRWERQEFLHSRINMRNKMYQILAGYTEEDFCEVINEFQCIAAEDILSTALGFGKLIEKGNICVVSNQQEACNGFEIHKL
ncbi:insulinase family protein [Pseudoflavonifractor capillosus]|uniref:insulinase family protein n=1 Tax=Pseudoflavonifractor capillosus TaxID=106588 RepID=UPI00195AA931|nr:insulinase family protein [Pseudoflavonifractor capillosus]MBM6897678.1 insulinase family protein [Pseudoflavonifractor capillosus]